MRFGACLAAAIAALALVVAPVEVLAAAQKKPAKAVKKASPAKSSKTRPANSTRTAAASLAPEPESAVEPLSDVQLVLASMVQIGRADCEFQQTVLIEPNLRQLGGFLVKFQKASYTMVPEQTTTGAIRLVDEKAGVVWLQIRYKSMLMNTRVGQRMVDACSMPEQRMAEAEAERVLRTAVENPTPGGTDAGPAPAKEQPLLRN